MKINSKASSTKPCNESKVNGLSHLGLCIIFLVSSGCSTTQIKNQNAQFAESKLAYSTTTLGLSDLTTFDIFVDRDTIHLLAGGKLTADTKQSTIVYSHLQSGNNDWSEAVPITKREAFISSRGNDLQIAAKDTSVLALWQSKGELPGMGPLKSAFSTDSGANWTMGTNPAATDAGDQSHHDLLADQQGHFHTVWLEDPEENGYQSLRYSHSEDSGKHWDQAQTLDDSTCSCCWNTIVGSPENNLHILYRDMKPRDMVILQSTNKGASWLKKTPVGAFGWQFDGCPHVGGSLAFAKNQEGSRLHSLVWTGANDKAGLYYLVSDDNGKQWSVPKKMGNTAIHGDIASLDNQVIAVWDELEAQGAAVFFTKSENGGLSWLTPTRLTSPTAGATHPRIAATESGFLAIWTEKTSRTASHLAWQMIK